MDAYKIIKKHGVPAGVPVITVYVDPDAPGESADTKLFGHKIITVGFVLFLITSTSEPFTATTLGKYLYDKGFNSSNDYLLINKTSISQSGTNRVQYQNIVGIFSQTGSDLKQRIESNVLSVADNVLSTSGTQVTTVSITFQGDTVYEI